MANNIQEVQRLLGHIPYGKSNAIHAEDIALPLGYPTGGNQVETRQLIRYTHVVVMAYSNKSKPVRSYSKIGAELCFKNQKLIS